MPVLIERIVDPRWTKPVWGLPGGSFRVVLDRAWSDNCVLELETAGRVVPVRSNPAAMTSCPGPATPGVFGIDAAIPLETLAGLYDLTLRQDDRRFCSHNSVCILEAEPTDFTFMHLTDLHFPPVRATNTDSYRCALRSLVGFINEQAPSFVCLTGDLVSRYVGKKQILSAQSIRQAAGTLQEILAGLRVPAVVTTGNHDVAFPESRKAWAAYMGRPCDRETDDFSFDIGQVHFSVLEAFVHYDPATHRGVGKGFSSEQLAWLTQDLQTSLAGSRVLITHYDYTGQLADILRHFDVDMILYGHSSIGMMTVPPGTFNGRLCGNECRSVSVRGGVFECETFDWCQRVGYRPVFAAS